MKTSKACPSVITRLAVAFDALVRDGGSLALLNRYQARLQSEYHRILKALMQMQSARAKQSGLPNEPNPNFEHRHSEPPGCARARNSARDRASGIAAARRFTRSAFFTSRVRPSTRPALQSLISQRPIPALFFHFRAGPSSWPTSVP